MFDFTSSVATAVFAIITTAAAAVVDILGVSSVLHTTGRLHSHSTAKKIDIYKELMASKCLLTTVTNRGKRRKVDNFLISNLGIL